MKLVLIIELTTTTERVTTSAAAVAEVRRGFARSESAASAYQTQINSLTQDFVNRDDPAQRAVIEKNRTKVVAELERT